MSLVSYFIPLYHSFCADRWFTHYATCIFFFGVCLNEKIVLKTVLCVFDVRTYIFHFVFIRKTITRQWQQQLVPIILCCPRQCWIFLTHVEKHISEARQENVELSFKHVCEDEIDTCWYTRCREIALGETRVQMVTEVSKALNVRENTKETHANHLINKQVEGQTGSLAYSAVYLNQTDTCTQDSCPFQLPIVSRKSDRQTGPV